MPATQILLRHNPPKAYEILKQGPSKSRICVVYIIFFVFRDFAKDFGKAPPIIGYVRSMLADMTRDCEVSLRRTEANAYGELRLAGYRSSQ